MKWENERFSLYRYTIKATFQKNGGNSTNLVDSSESLT